MARFDSGILPLSLIAMLAMMLCFSPILPVHQRGNKKQRYTTAFEKGMDPFMTVFSENRALVVRRGSRISGKGFVYIKVWGSAC